MTHPNKKKGNAFETRFLQKMKSIGATRIHRHYGSIGITDVEWTDKEGQKHEAQLKFSSKKTPYISQKEAEELYDYAKSKTDGTIVWLVKKQAYKPMNMKRLN